MLRGLLTVLLIAAPSPALAADAFLSWSDCGTFGQRAASFACNVNTGQHFLIASFTAPAVTQFVAVETELVVDLHGTAVPDWWRLRNQGTQINQCRNGSLSVDASFSDNGLSSCADPWLGGVGGLGSYQVAPPLTSNPAVAVVKAVAAIPAPIALVEGEHYYAVRFVLNHAKTTGAGACAGCGAPASIALLSLKVVQQTGAPGGNVTLPVFSYPLNSGSHDESRLVVGWQCPASGETFCDFDRCSFSTSLNCPTPARRSTWGAVKSLYR